MKVRSLFPWDNLLCACSFVIEDKLFSVSINTKHVVITFVKAVHLK